MRSCGKCYVCCDVPRIDSGTLNKPAYTICERIDCSLENGYCSIYKERSLNCAGFECTWKQGYGKEDDRPDLSGLFAFIRDFNGGEYIFAIELVPHAVFESGKNIILDMVKKIDNLAVIVSNYGVKPPYDNGDRVIVKSSLLYRSRNIRGIFLNNLAPDVGVYVLKDSK